MMGMIPDRSSRIRNYSVAAFFIALAIVIVSASAVTGYFFSRTIPGGYGDALLTVSSQCENTSANLFIGANSDLKDVKCVALDTRLVENPEITIGGLSKGDEEVCRFRLSTPTTEPLRFEVHYNGKVLKDVCDWQRFTTVYD